MTQGGVERVENCIRVENRSLSELGSLPIDTQRNFWSEFVSSCDAEILGSADLIPLARRRRYFNPQDYKLKQLSALHELSGENFTKNLPAIVGTSGLPSELDTAPSATELSKYFLLTGQSEEEIHNYCRDIFAYKAETKQKTSGIDGIKRRLLSHMFNLLSDDSANKQFVRDLI